MKPRFLIILANVFFVVMLTGCTTPQITEIPENESHIYINPKQRTTLFRVIRKYNAKRALYITPNISPKMLANARQSCVTASEEEILAILDSTIFKDAKNCLVIGTSGIYINNDRVGDSPGRWFIPYDEFINIQVRHYKWYEVSMGGIDFNTSACSMPDNKIVELLQDIQLCLVNVGT